MNTSITDKAGRKHVMVGLTLLIVLRSTLIAGMNPPDITVIFFGIIPSPPGVATRQFCVKTFADKAEQLQTVYHNCTQRFTEERLARKG